MHLIKSFKIHFFLLKLFHNEAFYSILQYSDLHSNKEDSVYTIVNVIQLKDQILSRTTQSNL